MVTLAAALLFVLVNIKFKEKINSLGNKEREAYEKYIGWLCEVIVYTANPAWIWKMEWISCVTGVAK